MMLFSAEKEVGHLLPLVEAQQWVAHLLVLVLLQAWHAERQTITALQVTKHINFGCYCTHTHSLLSLAVSANRTPTGRSSSAAKNRAGPADAARIGDLKAQVTDLKVTVDGLEKERDFYFGKLREIEILVQEQLENSQGDTDGECIKEIQAILYRTEEGFEVPPEGEGEEDEQYDDETF